MSDFPTLTGKELLRALEKLGFSITRVKGSHHHLRHDDGRLTVVPVHAGESIGPGLLRRILSQADITRDELRRAL